MRIRLLLLPLLLLAASASPAAAQTDQPPLVYVFVIDGLDGDRVDSGQAP